MNELVEKQVIFNEGDILLYAGSDERFEGQTLILKSLEPWELDDISVWKTLDGRQGVFSEDYLSENYKKIGNIHDVDGGDVD